MVVVTRFVWPLHLPLSVKCVAALLPARSGLPYHLWSRLSSGSVFAPEFPRPVCHPLQLGIRDNHLPRAVGVTLDGATLIAMAVHGGRVNIPDGARYAIGGVAAILAAIGVRRAVQVPPLKDIEIGIQGLAPKFDGYTFCN